MTRGYVKFASLFALVAMFLGLMATGCSEGNNTAADVDDVAAGRMTVLVTRELTAGKGEFKNIDNIRLWFDNVETEASKEVWFWDPEKVPAGGNAWIGSEVTGAIAMPVEFSKKEVAEEYNMLWIEAYKGETMVGMYIQEIPTITEGDNATVTVDEEDFETEAYTPIIVAVSSYDKTTGKGIPEGTNNIDIVLTGDKGEKVERFVSPDTQGAEAKHMWVENEDGTIGMVFTLTAEEVKNGYNHMSVLALRGDAEILGYVGDDITIEADDYNFYDFSNEKFESIDPTLDVNVKWNTACTKDIVVMYVDLVDASGNIVFWQSFCREGCGFEGVPYWDEEADGVAMHISSATVGEEVYADYVEALDKNPVRVNVFCYSETTFNGLWHIDQAIERGFVEVNCTDEKNYVAPKNVSCRMEFGCADESGKVQVEVDGYVEAELTGILKYTYDGKEITMSEIVYPSEYTVKFLYNDTEEANESVSVEDIGDVYCICGKKDTEGSSVEVKAILEYGKVIPGIVNVSVISKG